LRKTALMPITYPVRPHHNQCARGREEAGFGLIEVLIAMTVLMIGILALFSMFEAGIRQLSRASTVTTTGALADRELESFVAMRYDSIGLPDSLVTTAASPYASDPAYSASVSTRVGLNACGTAPCTTKVPVQTLTGADGRSYRVDTYATWASVTGGRNVKRVTIVVRDASNTAKVWARTTSTFDASTGT
jgi:Tfp pilus assembly protein PilV